MVKATNGYKLVVWKLVFRPPVVALTQRLPDKSINLEQCHLKNFFSVNEFTK